jgi:hypothetical protein
VTAPHSTDEWRYLRVAWVLVGLLVVAQAIGWVVARTVDEGPTPLELTEKCLRREKLLGVTLAGNDPLAGRAEGGTLSTRVGDNGVVVAIARSDDEASELAEAYLATGRKIEERLDRRGRVLYVWELPRPPHSIERQTMYDCWYE